jgi:translation initiation factor IF-2
MSEATDKGLRLSKVAREFNLGVHTVVEFLEKKGHKVESNPNTKIPGELYDLLQAEFGTDKEIKAKSQQVVQQRQERETIALTKTEAKAAATPKAEPKAKAAEPEAPAPAPAPPPPPPRHPWFTPMPALGRTPDRRRATGRRSSRARGRRRSRSRR